MTEVRDIAGFALPFAAGVLLASFIPLSGLYGLSAMIAGFIPPGIVYLIYGTRIRHDRNIQSAALIALAIPTGFICFTTAYATEICSTGQTSAITAAATGFCRQLKDTIDSVPFRNEVTGELIKALITGDRHSLPPETEEFFRKSGASHILALSGLHLGMVYGILAGITSWAGNTFHIKAARSFLIVIICGLYTIGTGAGDSMTRAFLFIMTNEAGTLLHRKCKLPGLLMTTLIIQLAADPAAIRSVSFQLSYAAMAGIAFIHPHLKGFWPDDGQGPFRRIWNNASLSISCQITTGPLVWHYFGTIPGNFLITNLIATPLTSLIIPAALLTVVLYAAGICPHFIVTATELAVDLLIGSLETISVM